MDTKALHDLVSEYLDDRAASQTKATVVQYRWALEGHWLPWCDAESITQPEQITEPVLNRYVAQLNAYTTKGGKPLSVHSVRTYLRSVRLFLGWAEREKAMGRVKIEGPKEPKRLLPVLSREEIKRIEDVAVDERDRLIVRLLADTGIRVSELLGLTKDSLHENSHDRQFWIKVIGKGDKQRDVPMPPALYRRLRHYAEHGGPRGAEALFSGKRRRPNGEYLGLTKSGVDQLIRNIADKAKIGRRVYPHLFRHSYATHQLKSGASSVLLMKVLGHESLAMISRTYSHLVVGDTFDAMVKNLQ